LPNSPELLSPRRVTITGAWTYRIQPSVVHRPYTRIDNGSIGSGPFNDLDASQLRWSPIAVPQQPTDFVEGIITLGGNGDVATQVGIGFTSAPPIDRWPIGFSTIPTAKC
jgi:homogentisate 1,2-dioxygenase